MIHLALWIASLLFLIAVGYGVLLVFIAALYNARSPAARSEYAEHERRCAQYRADEKAAEEAEMERLRQQIIATYGSGTGKYKF